MLLLKYLYYPPPHICRLSKDLSIKNIDANRIEKRYNGSFPLKKRYLICPLNADHNAKKSDFRLHRVSLHSPLSSILIAFTLSTHCCAKSIGWGRGNEYNTFEVVDNHGYVSIFNFLGYTPTRAKGRGIPLYAAFNSKSENSSPYAGYGCKIDLLESRLLQQDANRYKVSLPNGRELIFVRDNNDKNRLISSQIWNGEVRGDTITIKSKEQGWFQYQKGKLISMKVDEGLYEYHYTQGNLTAISENGLPLIKIRRSKTEVRLVAFNEQSIAFNLTTRPKIYLVDKKLKKTGDELALGEVTTPFVTINQIF